MDVEGEEMKKSAVVTSDHDQNVPCVVARLKMYFVSTAFPNPSAQGISQKGSRIKLMGKLKSLLFVVMQ